MRKQHRNLKSPKHADLKAYLIKMKGGECVRCGYAKCVRALSFHHVDPQTKLFNLGTHLASRPWEAVLAESRKCVILCLNCHAEVED